MCCNKHFNILIPQTCKVLETLVGCYDNIFITLHFNINKKDQNIYIAEANCFKNRTSFSKK